HGRWPHDPSSGLRIQRVAMQYRDIGPPVPGRDTDARGQVVNPINRAARIAARNHQGTRNAWDRVIHHLRESGLPLAANRADVYRVIANQPVDQATAADGPHEDYIPV